jgi:hypothetical protein
MKGGPQQHSQTFHDLFIFLDLIILFMFHFSTLIYFPMFTLTKCTPQFFYFHSQTNPKQGERYHSVIFPFSKHLKQSIGNNAKEPCNMMRYFGGFLIGSETILYYLRNVLIVNKVS